MRTPDSVLVVHRDRIDTEGRLHLSRIAGPDGRAVWAAPLGLSILQSVMPGTDSLVLFGRAFVQPRKEPGDPYHSSHEHLLAIDTKTGAVQTFNITTVWTPRGNHDYGAGSRRERCGGEALPVALLHRR